MNSETLFLAAAIVVLVLVFGLPIVVSICFPIDLGDDE